MRSTTTSMNPNGVRASNESEPQEDTDLGLPGLTPIQAISGAFLAQKAARAAGITVA
jgi:hypothetical protein